jgi:hypothetical protein
MWLSTGDHGMVTVDEPLRRGARHWIGSPVVVVVKMVDAAANVVELGMVVVEVFSSGSVLVGGDERGRTSRPPAGNLHLAVIVAKSVPPLGI